MLEPKPGSLVRAHQIAGIRELADWLESHPEVPMPFALDDGDLSIHVTPHRVEDPKATLAAVAKALPGKVTKSANDASGHFNLNGSVGGIKLHVIAYRNEVCERVVTGTREVTKTIPDPMVTVPTIEVTEVVEDVEWVCGSVLAGKA